ncbi:PKD domain-containing protein [Fluviicola sp.]|uniref:PKD domain-containing protein n=1 Tax=Fluviicola sp. TaxID=1917219 RepID=UPI002630C559|nr:PKD domain-containing protein [Fluviicola sp.]
MKCWLLFVIFFAASLSPGNLRAQISGVINQYTPVTAVSCNQLQVVDASFLSVGNRVLIIQMKGAEIDLSNSSNFGTITNYNNCGNYEFANVTAISGNTVTLQFQLLNGYDVAGRVQLIRVPQYTNTTVTGTLFPQNWNGSTGGVLVLEVSGTLTINAPVSANGTGFRGSFSSSNPDGGCGNFTDYYYPVSSGHGAQKGEGIAEVSAAMDGGRGALANGGGGGNKHNSGGGGGSNGSKGGRGGDQAGFCGQQPIGGEGGKALHYGLGRLFMGGGGGSPDYNDNVGCSGSNGGGIIIIRAATIVTNNNMFIESSGANVVSTYNSIGDGSGGGGAGGTIALEVNSFVGNLILRVGGGDGGNQMTTYPSCFGPGGGGGTGAIQYSGSAIPPNVTTSFIPGDVGTVIGNSGCNSSYGAASGYFSPVYVFNKPLPESNIPPTGTIDLGPDIVVCALSVVVDPTINATSYLWSTGETTPTITVTTSGEYWLSVKVGASSCWVTDTFLVNLNSLTVDAGPDQTICIGENAVLHAVSPGSNINFSWDNGVTNDVPFSPQTTSVYTVTATDPGAGCSATDEVLITVNPLPVVSVLPSPTSGCAPLSVTFTNLTLDCTGSTWTFSDGTVLNGCGNQQLTFENPGCYDLVVDVVSALGCSASANFPSIVCVHPAPLASFHPSPVILNQENPSTTMINNSEGGIHYEWNFGDGTASDLVSPVHTYSSDEFRSFTASLLVTNQYGCTDVAYGTVYMEGGLIYYVPNTFTPDGNEMNGIFIPIFSSGLDSSDFNLQIFNRWGEIVFESKDPQIGWDGTYNGSPSPEGIYTWRIEFRVSTSVERKIIHGHLNLLR